MTNLTLILAFVICCAVVFSVQALPVEVGVVGTPVAATNLQDDTLRGIADFDGDDLGGSDTYGFGYYPAYFGRVNGLGFDGHYRYHGSYAKHHHGYHGFHHVHHPFTVPAEVFG